jgi:hypothetical protein
MPIKRGRPVTNQHGQAGPDPERVKMPAGYEAAGSDTLLAWSHVTGRLENAINYWLATTRPDGRPHVTPIWAVWVAEALYFTGIPTARWARNMAVNPTVAVHLESGDDVVILEGNVVDIKTIPDAELSTGIVQAWDAKYGRLHPDPVNDGMFRLRPSSVRAWSSFPDDATRWELETT